MQSRSSGVLLHISSLPSAGGIGDIGPAAHRFARLLAAAGQSLWQILPLNPTSSALGNSPYSSFSAFAGNPLFISPESLVRQGMASYADLDAAQSMACRGNGFMQHIDFPQVEKERQYLLHTVFERNRHILSTDPGFLRFCAEHRHWLDDYALFATLKAAHAGRSWVDWPESLRVRDPHTLAAWAEKERIAVQRECFIQYVFFTQWGDLRRVCGRLGLRLVGDLPIYVTHDSADVWAHPQYFKLDSAGNLTVVAGVPPDYFSETGQRWGNPVYRWDALRADGFQWWLRRVEHNLLLCDWIRLDHFRGFAGYWEIPVAEATAVNGAWVPAAGKELFAALAERFPHLPFIAEDLGVITHDVRELQHAFALPGMKVLQFAFAGDLVENPHIPFLCEKNAVIYSGTHDNAPTRAWFAAASDEEKQNLMEYVGHEVSGEDAHQALIRLGLASVASMAVFPMQDILGLGAETRMNTPSLPSGNWTWRLTPDELRPGCLDGLAGRAAFYGRHAGKKSSVPVC